MSGFTRNAGDVIGARVAPCGRHILLVGIACALVACASSAEPAVAVDETSRSVTVSTPDGLSLAGQVYGDGDDAVLLAHMRGGSKSDWAQVAPQLADRGLRVLAFDFRGYGDSEGTRDRDLDVDLAAAAESLWSDGTGRVIAIGASMGGTASIVEAAQGTIDAVVSLSGPVAFAGLDAGAAAGQLGVPALFIAAEDDQPYADDARRMAAAAGVEASIYEGSSHGTALFADHGSDLIGELERFIEAALGP